jgi:hypothetical protein
MCWGVAGNHNPEKIAQKGIEDGSDHQKRAIPKQRRTQNVDWLHQEIDDWAGPRMTTGRTHCSVSDPSI